MKKGNFIYGPLMSLMFRTLLLGVFILCGCAARKPNVHVSQYRFIFNDEAYRLRSISSKDKMESYNELVGANFLAVDFDQDRVIDRILLGDASLSDAQKIYEYGLNRLIQENRLQLRRPNVQRYVYESCDSHLEIISFRPANAPPFNEFKIMDKRQMVSPQIIVMIDQNADGVLDEALKGEATPAEAQAQYAEAIEAGLQKGVLIKVSSMILVKEK